LKGSYFLKDKIVIAEYILRLSNLIIYLIIH